MKRLELATIALAAAMLTGCSVSETNDETLSAAPAPVTTPPEAPAEATTTAAPAATAQPVSAKPQENVETFNARIDASAFLNSLVESGCQIDKAEYKEVKRGGAIKVVCSKTVDALNVDLDDF